MFEKDPVLTQSSVFLRKFIEPRWTSHGILVQNEVALEMHMFFFQELWSVSFKILGSKIESVNKIWFWSQQ